MALVDLGRPAADALLSALESADLPARAWITSTLSHLEDRRAIAPLLEFFRSVDLFAARACGC